MHDIISQYEDIYKNYMEMISNNQISNILSVRVKESFFKSEQLSEFIKSSEFNIKKLLFQIIHTLAVLQKEYPGFRHNMLNLSNIFVYLKKHENEMYELNSKKYYIPDNNFEIKITNFFLANIPNKYGSNVDGVLNVPFFDY
jgi:ERCC4-related helicase